ncbi:MAG: 4-aminobutyrate--2-oxoglutarate transaminase [Pseudomonadota bacterium]
MTTNEDLLARRHAAVARGVSTMMPIFADRAENSEVWDVEGRRYIDFAGGIAVLNFGHRHPKIMAAIEAQLQRFTHTAFQVLGYESYIDLAERLNKLAPGDGPNKTFFASTGAEAVENSIKIARAYTKRPGIVAFTGAFHGRTMFTGALTGKVVPYKAGFGPFPSDIYRLPFPAAAHGLDDDHTMLTLDWLFKTDVEADKVAAIIIEPVQGEGGFHVASPAFLQALRAKCDEHGILLISDEIQAGIARTGKYFAIEHSGVVPDMITVAKSLAGGIPLAGVVGRADIMDAPAPGGLGGTYGGNPIGCAAALAVLDLIEEEGMLARSLHIGELVSGMVRDMGQKFQTVELRNLRGLGAMVGFDICNRADGAPLAPFTKELVAACLADGLIILPCGMTGNTIRLLMPLTASDDLITDGMKIIERNIEKLDQVAQAA